MEENKYINEDQYQKSNKKVKSASILLIIFGILIFISGAVCFILFIVKSEEAMNDGSASTPLLLMFSSFFQFFIGGSLTMTGGMLAFISHGREIRAYTTQQAMPVVKETVNDVTPTVANAAGSIAKEVSKGIKEGQEDE